ncbi:MAG TPA: FosX/FosE/FosI family fosfomycin resistance hydrolase [Candidatus Saccharimonadales bacterium]|nr:FosX/FosE/FosI family fosfomycin resistance hydrolase [Candidatus Saccharimonadales bacterium]
MNSQQKIKGLSHITFICKDLEKAAHMFKHIFGAEEVYSSGDKTFSISKERFFKVAGLWIALMEGSSVEKTYNHIAFQVDIEDLPELEERVRSLGLTILPGRKRENAEGDSLYFYDYDNHLLELHTGDLDTRLEYYNHGK